MKWNAILGNCCGIRGAPFPIAFGGGSLEMPANIHTHGKSKGAACEEENEYSLWGSNPRPMAHKTIALTTELREPNTEMLFNKTIFQKKQEWKGNISATLLAFPASFHFSRISNAGYSSVGRASDCRSLQQSDGPWFDSGWPDVKMRCLKQDRR